jgi:hypothetical protein
VQNDLDALRAQAQQYFPARTIPFAITEFNSLFTLNLSPTDQYPETLASAMYVADLFIMFSNRSDMMFANFFQFLDGYVLGAVSPSGNLRPGGEVLTAFSSALKGNLLPITVQSGTFNAPAVGFFTGLSNVPLISALATENQGAISLILINKDVANTENLTVHFSGPPPAGAITEQVLFTGNFFQTFPDGGLTWTATPAPALINGALTVPMQPHSIAMLTILP